MAKKSLNVVLVHGGFVDGAGWKGVYGILRKDGYNVSIVQNPTITLADDVAATKLILAAQDRPVILVGHSYGGVVITEAGNDPKVAGLVYVAASLRTRASLWPRSSRIRRPVRLYLPSCLLRMAFCFWTKRSSQPHSRPTWTRKRPGSWPTHRCPGAWIL